jgi:hypothetical protein
MTEYRLHVGFIHCPIPYLGARHLPEIYAISISEAMKPWETGGKYSRPIPRRIIEGIGVARESFGQYKRGSSVLWFEKTGLHDGSAVKDYEKWLATKSSDFRRAGKRPPLFLKRVLAPFQWIAKFGWSINNRTKSLPTPFKWISRIGRKLGEFSRKEYAAEYMFGWALERTQRLYLVDAPKSVSTATGPAAEQRALSASAA